MKKLLKNINNFHSLVELVSTASMSQVEIQKYKEWVKELEKTLNADQISLMLETSGLTDQEIYTILRNVKKTPIKKEKETELSTETQSPIDFINSLPFDFLTSKDEKDLIRGQMIQTHGNRPIKEIKEIYDYLKKTHSKQSISTNELNNFLKDLNLSSERKREIRKQFKNKPILELYNYIKDLQDKTGVKIYYANGNGFAGNTSPAYLRKRQAGPYSNLEELVLNYIEKNEQNNQLSEVVKITIDGKNYGYIKSLYTRKSGFPIFNNTYTFLKPFSIQMNKKDYLQSIKGLNKITGINPLHYYILSKITNISPKPQFVQLWWPKYKDDDETEFLRKKNLITDQGQEIKGDIVEETSRLFFIDKNNHIKDIENYTSKNMESKNYIDEFNISSSNLHNFRKNSWEKGWGNYDLLRLMDIQPGDAVTHIQTNQIGKVTKIFGKDKNRKFEIKWRNGGTTREDESSISKRFV